MRWKSKREERYIRKTMWHDFFCVLPRRVSQDHGPTLWVWLETVERKGTYHWDSEGWWKFSYRLKNKN